MATEITYNDFGTLLVSDCTDSDTTIDVGSVAAFPDPFTGLQCRIRIGDEILLVTAVNTGTNVLTVVRGQESTTAVSHATGAQVLHVLTSGGLSTLVNQGLSGGGVAASRPASYPNAGQVYWNTDSSYINLWNGSAFVEYYLPKVSKPPVVSNWTTYGSGCSFSDSSQGVVLKTTSTGSHGGAMLPVTAPYNIAVTYRCVSTESHADSWVGMYWFDGTTPTKATMFSLRSNCNWIIYDITNYNSSPSFSGIYDPNNTIMGMTGPEIHMIFSDDGTTNRTAYISPDGVNYISAYGFPRSRSSNSVYTHLGVGTFTNSPFLAMTLTNWRAF